MDASDSQSVGGPLEANWQAAGEPSCGPPAFFCFLGSGSQIKTEEVAGERSREKKHTVMQRMGQLCLSLA